MPKKIQITQSLMGRLQTLCGGGTIPSSSLKGEWVEELKAQKVLLSVINGSKVRYKAKDAESLKSALIPFNEVFADWETAIRVMDKGQPLTRAEMAKETGDSKIQKCRSNVGFLVNSYTPIKATLKGQPVTIKPHEGSCVFISSPDEFRPDVSVTIVGIENMENFHEIRRQRAFFSSYIQGVLLFVSRFQASNDLRDWLMSIPNKYVHFGDFDLAGIAIFQNEFEKYLPERSSFLIPDDIGARLKNGSRERYDSQYLNFKEISSETPSLQILIDTIHMFRRGYDQEGYIDATNL